MKKAGEPQALSLAALDNHVDNHGQVLYGARKPLICNEFHFTAAFFSRMVRLIPVGIGQSCG